MTKSVPVAFRMDEELALDVKLLCAIANVPIKIVVEGCLRSWLADRLQAPLVKEAFFAAKRARNSA